MKSILLACSVVLGIALCLNCWTLLADGKSAETIKVEDVDCGKLLSGDEVEHTVRISITNHASHNVRLIGGSAGCQGYTCHRVCIFEPIAIEPGAQVDVPVSVRLRRTGQFEIECLLYFDNGSVQSTIAHLRGEGIAP